MIGFSEKVVLIINKKFGNSISLRRLSLPSMQNWFYASEKKSDPASLSSTQEKSVDFMTRK